MTYPADVLTIPKMWYFWSFKGFEPELLAVKVESNFGKSARFQVPKNGISSAELFERTPKPPRNTPQNGGVLLVHVFPFSGEYQANFSSSRGSFPIMIDPNTKIKSTVSFMGL